MILVLEMERLNTDVLGISETRWCKARDLLSGEYHIIHSGTADNRPGHEVIGVVLHKTLENRVIGYVQLNERIILVTVDTRPNKTVIIELYMPTTEEDERIYEDPDKLIENVKGEENLIVLGDWNATVG